MLSRRGRLNLAVTDYRTSSDGNINYVQLHASLSVQGFLAFRSRQATIGQFTPKSGRAALRPSRSFQEPICDPDVDGNSPYVLNSTIWSSARQYQLAAWNDTSAMAEHLVEIRLAVDPGCHAVVLLDQAGWHGSVRLAVHHTTTLPSTAQAEFIEERVAVHAQQMTVEPGICFLRRHS